MKIANTTYNIQNQLNKNIVLISDIHYSNKKDIKRLDYILDNIKKINPDYICIPGDIIDRSKVEDENDFIKWLEKLSNICKVIVSIGNHEFYKDDNTYGLNEEFFNKLSKINNLYLLDNDNAIIDNINFIGLTIPMEYYNEKYNNNNFYKCIKDIKINKKYYNILLCHSPIQIMDSNILKKINVDLILCGHMHGGAVPEFLRFIFKDRGIISPNKLLFPKNVYGSFYKEKTNIIITSGLRVLPYKLLNKLLSSEIVVIKI